MIDVKQLAQWLDTLLVPGDPDRPRQAAKKLRELEADKAALADEVSNVACDVALTEMTQQRDTLRADLTRQIEITTELATENERKSELLLDLSGQKELADASIAQFKAENERLRADYEFANAELKRVAERTELRAALVFYSNRQRYFSGVGEWSDIQRDEGEVARVALGGER